MGITAHREVERKLDVDDDATVPDLGAVPGAVGVAPVTERLLVAEYLDTPGLALLRAGVTLRRRAGGDDAGWHLKLPRSATERTELRVPLASHEPGKEPGHEPGIEDGSADGNAATDVPAALLERVRGIVRDHPVVVVAVLETRRSVHAVLGPAAVAVPGSPTVVLAEVCDDRVTARVPAGAARTWREWEVELVNGGPDVLSSVTRHLEDAGARPARHGSKLERALALGDRGVNPAAAVEGSRARAVAGRLLRDQISDLLEADLRIRSGDEGSTDDAIHDARVAARRLRSTLTTYARALAVPAEGRAADEVPSGPPLVGELRALGQALSEARDAHVMLVRFQAALADQPAELVVGPVSARIDAELTAAVSHGVGRGLEALGSPRYFRLLDALEALADDACAAPSVGPAATKVARRSLRADVVRVERALRIAEATEGPSPALDVALHEVRKKAKRVRYAAEAAVGLLGPGAERLADAARRLQVELGEHQDGVVARRQLTALALQARQHGEDEFTYGRLHALEETTALRVERQVAAAHRRWRREARRFSR